MNRGDRETHVIDYPAAANLVAAILCAIHRGEAPNYFITIHLETIWARRAQRFVTRFMKSLGDWLAYKGTPRVYVWVLENPSNHGLHLHVIVRFPPGFALPKELAIGWAEKAGASAPDAPGGIEFERVYNPMRLVSYLLKGAEAETLQRLEENYPEFTAWDPSPQGRIVGKRCGVSERIDRAARFRYYRRIALAKMRSLR